MDTTIAPSMMCADPMRFKTDLEAFEALGCKMLHLDVMDGHFVPNLALGLPLIKALAKETECVLDVHLMVSDCDFFSRELATYGVHRISVHAEAAQHLDRSLGMIRDQGMKAGVALNPATPLSALDYIRERLDFVVLMTVNPGFAGQALTPASLRKIQDCSNYLASHGLEIPIQVDGNVSFENIPKMVAAGANELVAGTSSVFSKSGTFEENWQKVEACIQQGRAVVEA